MNTNLKWKPNRTTATLSAALTLVALGAAQTGHAQNLFESDYDSGTIYEFTPSGTRTTFATGLNGPCALAFNSSGNLFEADGGGNTIYEFAPNGTRTTFATGLNNPYGLAFQPASAPEASTVFDVLGGLALGGAGLLIRRRRK